MFAAWAPNMEAMTAAGEGTAEANAAIVAAPTEAERLDIEAKLIVQTDNGLQPDDPVEQPSQVAYKANPVDLHAPAPKAGDPA